MKFYITRQDRTLQGYYPRYSVLRTFEDFFFPEPTEHHHGASVTVFAVKFARTQIYLNTLTSPSRDCQRNATVSTCWSHSLFGMLTTPVVWRKNQFFNRSATFRFFILSPWSLAFDIQNKWRCIIFLPSLVEISSAIFSVDWTKAQTDTYTHAY